MHTFARNPVICALAAAALCAPSSAVQTSTQVVNFGPNPPQYYPPTGSLPNLPSMRTVRTTLGDVNADGVSDFVFSNQLGYLAVYLFPDRTYQAVPTLLLIRDPGLAASNQCSDSTPAGWRRRTLSNGHDEVLIYDIDLDGRAEIICTDLAYSSASTAEVGICIYDIETDSSSDPTQPVHTWSKKSLTTNYASFHTISFPPAYNANVAPIGKTFAPQGGTTYFQCGDKPGGVGVVVKMEIGNVRGLATPQDILVWTLGQNLDFDHSVYGYSNGQGATPNSLNVLMHVSPGYDGEIPSQGEPGHTRLLVDANGDGKDEVFGRHLFEYDTSINQPSQYQNLPHVKNGRYLWSIQHLQGNDKHVDAVVGGDVIRSFREASTGRIVAAPGNELAMCPQHPELVSGGSSTGIDGGSGWIVRGVTGFQAPRWPRMIIGHSPAHDYYTAYNAINYVEPFPTSNWDSLGTSVGLHQGATVVGDLDPQEIYLGNFLASSDGPELLLSYKSIPRVTPPTWQYPNLLWRLNGSLIGTDPGLTVHNWWFNFGSLQSAAPYGQNTLRNGPGFEVRPLDFHGTRDEIECVSDMRGLLLGLPNYNPGAPQNHSDPFHKLIFQLTGGLTQSNPVLYSAYPANSKSPADAWYGHAMAADMVGDNREEYVIVFRPGGGPAFAHIISSTDTATGNSRVGQRSPEAFLDYQRLRGTTNIDYERFDAPRIHADVLPEGVVSQVYGRVLDRAFWPTAGTQVQGAALLPEGGVPPYTITLVEGVPHAGLQPVARPVRDHAVAGSPPVQAYAGAISIEGTPQESGFRRLRFQLVDAVGTTSFKELWLHVADPSGGPTSDPRPKILAGSFDGAYLTGGVPQDVIVRAMVSDNQNDCSGVAILGANGSPLGITALDNGSAANGDLVAGDGIFSAKAPGLNLPAGLALNVQMIAFDAALHVSPTWPYVQVEGGPQGDLPLFETSGPPSPQTQAQTPTIDFVYLPATELPAAERTDATGAQGIIAVLRYVPAGTTVTEVLARIHHPVAGVSPFEVQLAPIAPGSLTWAGTFISPSGEVGYGRYSVNVRAKVTVTGTSTEHFSDWWPSLRWH